MSDYLIKFKPMSPWFFGNEKTFLFPGQKIGEAYKNSYFIRSENLPSQSTILGVLRYILLPHKKQWKDYKEDEIRENGEAVGTESFDIDNPVQTFGKIKKLSPVFIMNGDERLIPAPLNHKYEVDALNNSIVSSKYNPISDFRGPVNTHRGQGLYAEDYNAKTGICDGFLSLKDGTIYPIWDIIGSEERVGINRYEKKRGFFKKEYKFFWSRTDKNYAFAVYAELDALPEGAKDCRIVTMGQGKSAFSVSIEESKNGLKDFTENSVKEFLNERMPGICVGGKKYEYHYCLSDVLAGVDPYEDTAFAVTSTKDYRAFKTNATGKIEKGSRLHRLIKAGSLFITEKGNGFSAKFKNDNVENIGFNKIITFGGKDNGNESQAV